ncbi:hypothetical protein PFTANZ_05804, partial [Plasmodium falciparum Tanzania (2000708)]
EEDEEDEDEDEEEEEEGEEEEEDKEAASETAEVTEQGEEETAEVENLDGESEEKEEKEVPGPTTTPGVTPACEIVQTLFGDKTNLTKACQQKYDGKYYGWKCVTPSGVSTTTGESSPTRAKRHTESSGSTTTGSSGVTATSGSICVPPRRRRLYVTPLTKWANKHNTEAKSQETSDPGSDGDKGEKAPQLKAVGGQAQQQPVIGESPPASTPASTSSRAQSDPLLAAFVKSAAVETFFLWDRYKKEKEKKKPQGVVAPLPLPPPVSGSGDPDPQTQLKDGIIPEEFKRQMFYTLGDYRDILVRGAADDKNGGNNIVVNASSEDQKDKMKEIQKKIKEHINNGSKPPGTQQQTPLQQREKLWETYAQHIWNGMICALTYKESENGDKTIEKDGAVYEKFFGTPNGKPVPPVPPVTPGTTATPTGTQNGTYQEKYDYENVKLEDENGGTSPKTNEPSSPPSGDTPTLNNPTLKNFVEIPTFFRYLHEWGQNFCKERKKRLEEVKKECEVGEKGNRGCSGDGLNCNEEVPDKKDIFKDFHCSKCAKPCRKYRKWIERKKYEFTEQYNAYTGQKQKYEEENKGAKRTDHDNRFYTKLKETYTDAAKFLKGLGPCKVQNGEDEIKFDKDSETFKHTKHCDPCSKFKIKCENCKSSGDDTKGKCDGNNGGTTTITADDIKNGGNSTQKLDMLVSDNSGNGFKGDLNVCEGKSIFEGIRNDEWICGEFCGVHVCALKKKDTKEQESGKKYIIMKELLQRWLEYFLEDYNRIQKKLKPCIENGNGSTCQNKCQERCNCVKAWIEEKRKEWEKINATYIQEYTRNNDVTSNDLNSFLETLIPQMDLVNDKGKISDLNNLKKFYGCNCPGTSKKGEDDQKTDVIDCLFQKLETEVRNCANEPSAETQRTCDESSTHVEDDDDPLEEENPENKVGHPQICDEVLNDETKKEEPDKKCEEAASPDSTLPEKKEQEPAEKKNTEDQTPPAIPPPQPPSRPTNPPPYLSPPLKTALMSSTIMWSIGIGFATFTYFYLK